MSHELFMDLSEEQQELVAGGGQLIELDQIAKTYLSLDQKKSNTAVIKNVKSDLSGSSVSFGVINQYEEAKFKTGALEDVYLKFD